MNSDVTASAGFLTEPLFTPINLAGVTLPNRIAMAPMTRLHAPNGIPSVDVPAYYARRAAGGVGLIITEGVAPPHAVAHCAGGVPFFYGAALERWSEVVHQVHSHGSKIFVQLWHAGLARAASTTHNPEEASIGPSGMVPGGTSGRAMTDEDIADVIGAFADAAQSAQRVGFDGVNIHGAHGYLLDQFFWDATNRRGDGYGGSDIKARTRFAVELISGVRARIGPGFPIMLRWSQWKMSDYDAKLAHTPRELGLFLEPLVDAGVDAFDVSTRRFWLPEFVNSDLTLAGWTKKISGKTTMTVGSVGLVAPLADAMMGNPVETTAASTTNLTLLMKMFARGDFDLVALGRSLLMNPTWPSIVRRGAYGELKGYDQAAVLNRLEPSRPV
jgi:2,4-dienoyl-CoA reductase-like NADH-dependent reductase (Old Yellow Enzyme family)